jgi:hypothetical protein
MVASMAWRWAGMMEICLVGLMGDRTADCWDRRLVDGSVYKMVGMMAEEMVDVKAEMMVVL